MAEEQSREKVMINYQISHREIEKKKKKKWNNLYHLTERKV